MSHTKETLFKKLSLSISPLSKKLSSRLKKDLYFLGYLFLGKAFLKPPKDITLIWEENTLVGRIILPKYQNIHILKIMKLPENTHSLKFTTVKKKEIFISPACYDDLVCHLNSLKKRKKDYLIDFERSTLEQSMLSHFYSLLEDPDFSIKNNSLYNTIENEKISYITPEYGLQTFALKTSEISLETQYFESHTVTGYFLNNPIENPNENPENLLKNSLENIDNISTPSLKTYHIDNGKNLFKTQSWSIPKKKEDLPVELQKNILEFKETINHHKLCLQLLSNIYDVDIFPEFSKNNNIVYLFYSTKHISEEDSQKVEKIIRYLEKSNPEKIVSLNIPGNRKIPFHLVFTKKVSSNSKITSHERLKGKKMLKSFFPDIL